MTRVWLSFADPDVGFLGVAVIDVDDAAVEAARRELADRVRYPRAQPGAALLMAAVREARRLGCNPGGEVRAYTLDGSIDVAPGDVGRLLTRAEAAVYTKPPRLQ